MGLIRPDWVHADGRSINPAHIVSVRPVGEEPIGEGLRQWRLELITGENLEIAAGASEIERHLRGLRIQRTAPGQIDPATQSGIGLLGTLTRRAQRLLSKLPVDRRYRAGLVRGSRRASRTLGIRGLRGLERGLFYITAIIGPWVNR